MSDHDESLTDIEALANATAPILKAMNRQQLQKIGQEIERLNNKANELGRQANACRSHAATLTEFKKACDSMANITTLPGGQSAIAGSDLVRRNG